MTDEELIARLRQHDGWVTLEAHTHLTAADRIEALTEQLAAAQQDADEAEAYAWKLEEELRTTRMAQAVMDNTVADLEAKLAKAVEALERIAGVKGPYSHPFPESYEGYGAFAIVTSRETLEEIKGESHDVN